MLWLVDHHVVRAADVLHVPAILSGRLSARIEALAAVAGRPQIVLVLDALARAPRSIGCRYTPIGCGVIMDRTQEMCFSVNSDAWGGSIPALLALRSAMISV